MNTSLYETIQKFELRTDLHTKVIAEVSARTSGARRTYRVATYREYVGPSGELKRSHWLGTRELMLKPGLEKSALEFIQKDEAKRQTTEAQLQ